MVEGARMKNRCIDGVFFLGLLLASLLVFPLAIDYTLVPRFLGLGLCLLTVFIYLYRTKPSFLIRVDGVVLAYAAYTGFCALSLLWANTRSEALFDASRQVLAFLVFMLTVFCMKDPSGRFLDRVLKLSVILSGIALLAALYQVSEIRRFDREALYGITALNGHKNLFASFLFLNLFFLLQAPERLQGAWRKAGLAAIVLSLIAMVLLRTKAVWLGLLIVAAVYLFCRFLLPRCGRLVRKLSLISWSLITLVLIQVFFLVVLQPLIHKGIGYTSGLHAGPGLDPAYTFKLEEERLLLWDKTFHLVKQKPWLGVGAGNWQIYLPDATLTDLYRADDLNYTFQRPHNDFLWILSETGLLGFNLFLFFLSGLVFLLLRAGSALSDHRGAGRTIWLCLAFICGYFTVAFFDFPKERIEHTVWLNLLLGMAYVYACRYASLPTILEIRLRPAYTLPLVLLLCCIVTIGALRLKGEYFTRRMYDARNNLRSDQLICEGRSALSVAYTIDPTSMPLYWYMGNAEATLGNYQKARECFQKAFDLAPFSRHVLNDLGSAYAFTNDVLPAKKYYEEAARISPRFDEPRLNLAAICIQAGDFKMADYWLKSLLHDSERRSNYQKIVDLQMTD
jgi:O-antigen ligase